MTKMKTMALAAAALSLAALPVMAQDMKMDMSKPMHHHMSGDQGPSSKGYTAAMERMQKNMTMDYTGDADADFVRGMIPHHQGAIDMAKVELKYGKDPELRRMAEDIVKAQEKEIAEMKAWLKKHGK